MLQKVKNLWFTNFLIFPHDQYSLKQDTVFDLLSCLSLCVSATMSWRVVHGVLARGAGTAAPMKGAVC